MVRSILLRGFDQQMANLAGDYMVKVGVKFQRDSTPTSIEKTENGQLLVKSTAVPEGELYDTVLFAIGRRPETHKLNLAAAGFDQAKVDAAKGKLHTLIGERVRDGPGKSGFSFDLLLLDLFIWFSKTLTFSLIIFFLLFFFQ